MLVLTRHKNESIQIGGGITIVVVDIRGDKVRLGIEAPRETTIHRGELRPRVDKSDRNDRHNKGDESDANF